MSEEAEEFEIDLTVSDAGGRTGTNLKSAPSSSAPGPSAVGQDSKAAPGSGGPAPDPADE